MKIPTTIALVAMLPLTACSNQAAPQASDDPNTLTLRISTEVSGANCRPIADWSIGAEHELRFLNYDIVMIGPGDGDRTSIPGQQIFEGLSGIKDSRSISIHNYEAACGDMAVTISNLTCADQERQPIDCPPVVRVGGDEFKSFELAPADPV